MELGGTEPTVMLCQESITCMSGPDELRRASVTKVQRQDGDLQALRCNVLNG